MSKRILIVDDEEIIRNSLSHILKSEGYEVEEADDGDTALEKIRESSFDLVISDIKMPRMDGIAHLKKASAILPDAFFIIITAFGALETAVNALRFGAYDYIIKPLEFDDVLHRIKKLFEHSQLIKENKNLRQQLHEKYDFDNLIGQNQKMQDIFESIKKGFLQLHTKAHCF